MTFALVSCTGEYWIQEEILRGFLAMDFLSHAQQERTYHVVTLGYLRGYKGL